MRNAESNSDRAHALSVILRYGGLSETQRKIFSALVDETAGLSRQQLEGRFELLGSTVKKEVSDIRHRLKPFSDPGFRAPFNLREVCSISELHLGRPDSRQTNVSSYRVEWHRVLTPGDSLILTPSDDQMMRLAIEKMEADFKYSALTTPATLKTCFDQAVDSARFLIQKERVRGLRERIITEQRDLKVPSPTDRLAADPNPQVVSFCRELLGQPYLVVNCECIEVGALAALRSMIRKYGIRLHILDKDKSGRDVVQTMNNSEIADFAVVPNAPFLSLGGPEYRLVVPIHAEDQVLLRKGRHVDKTPRVLVYSSSSALEQWHNMKDNRPQKSHWKDEHPWRADVIDQLQRVENPELVHDLQKLVDESRTLNEGDYVIAWHPLSVGLKSSVPDLNQIGSEFHHWLWLVAHGKRWCSGPAADELRNQFVYMFIYEWRNCLKSAAEWAKPLLERDKGFLYYFSGGAGIG